MVPVAGNRITLLRNGGEFFPALESAIDAAAVEVRLETYIYDADATGRRIAEALKRAAARGVRVTLLVDGFGSRSLPASFLEDLRDSGVHVQVYRPERRWSAIRRSRLRRLHRKLALIDGKVGFVGGANIMDDSTQNAAGTLRLDYVVRVEGPLLAEIHSVMRRLWWLVSALSGRRPREWRAPRHRPGPAGETLAAFMYRDNVRHRHDIEAVYLRGIRGARREVVIACAYFLPGWRVRRALMSAAMRGVRVVLLLQGASDHPVMLLATRVLYEALLDHGIEIYEYTAGELHAKVGVVDERWATVGSSNLDPFSLVFAREANVVVLDETFARDLRRSLEHEIRDRSVAVRRMLWRRRPWPARLASWLAYVYARVVIGLAGVGGRWL